MENPENNDTRWAAARMARLDPPAEWTPDAGAALARLRARQRSWRRRIAGAVAGALAAAAGVLLLLALSAPQACATPTGCAEHFWDKVFSKHGAPPRPPAAAGAENFRQSGSPRAAVEIDVYSDYSCPACATFFREVAPRLIEDYVETGKVRLVHRDFPLPQHRWSAQAARYANAAGRLGYYDAAVQRIFETQEAWGTAGEIEAQLASVVPPDAMQRIRRMVAEDASLDDGVVADRSLAVGDQVRGTPTLVVVFKGKRESFFPAPKYELLKGYLDGLLAR
jgi:protein-disulfide isomerase